MAADLGAAYKDLCHNYDTLEYKYKAICEKYERALRTCTDLQVRLDLIRNMTTFGGEDADINTRC